jgi:hypothetical protein
MPTNYASPIQDTSRNRFAQMRERQSQTLQPGKSKRPRIGGASPDPFQGVMTLQQQRQSPIMQATIIPAPPAPTPPATDVGVASGNLAQYAGAPAELRGIVTDVAKQYGWNQGAEWNALVDLISRESSWNPNADNPTSTAYGLFQFLDGTWGGTGYQRTSDPRTQTLAGLRYILSRYGTPSQAIAFHNTHGWY